MYIPITLCNENFNELTYYIGQEYIFVINEEKYIEVAKGTLKGVSFRRGVIKIDFCDYEKIIDIQFIKNIINKHNCELEKLSEIMFKKSIKEDLTFVIDEECITFINSENLKFFNNSSDFLKAKDMDLKTFSENFLKLIDSK